MITRKFAGLCTLGLAVSFVGRDLRAQQAAPESPPAPSTRTAKPTDPLDTRARAGSSAPAPKVDPELTRTQDPLFSPETRSAVPGSQADEPFLQRLFEALFEEEPAGEGEAAQPRRLPPAPYQSPPFPFSEHLGRV
jgi:hypothetical protein